MDGHVYPGSVLERGRYQRVVITSASPSYHLVSQSTITRVSPALAPPFGVSNSLVHRMDGQTTRSNYPALPVGYVTYLRRSVPVL